MTRRKVSVSLFVAVFVGGSAVSLITQRDFWPFSHYPMFAANQGRELVVLDVVGISANGSAEIPLAPSRRTSIVAGTRYLTLLDRLVERGSDAQVRDYLVAAARRHDAARSAGEPALAAVRLFRTRWQAVPDEWPPARRVDRQLLAHVDLDR